MPDNGNGASRPSSWLDEIADRARIERERLTVKRTGLMHEVALVDAELKRIGRLERAVDDTPATAKRNRKSHPTYVPSDKKVLKTAEAVLELYDSAGEFTMQQLAQHVGEAGGESSRKALMQLRRMEFVGKGKRVKLGEKGMPTQHWIVLDRHVIDDLRERVSAAD